MHVQKTIASTKPGAAVELVGRATASQSARDTLLLVLAGVPDDKLDAFAEDYARRRLAPVVAAKIRAKGGDPNRGEAALVIARALLEDAVKRRREGGMQRGRA